MRWTVHPENAQPLSPSSRKLLSFFVDVFRSACAAPPEVLGRSCRAAQHSREVAESGASCKGRHRRHYTILTSLFSTPLSWSAAPSAKPKCRQPKLQTRAARSTICDILSGRLLSCTGATLQEPWLKLVLGGIHGDCIGSLINIAGLLAGI